MADLEMTPETIHEDLAGWILGALDADEAERFRAHLASCRECREAEGQLGPAAGLLKAVGEDEPAGSEPPEDLRERTLERVRQASRKSFWKRRNTRLGSAAAAVVVAAGAATAITVAQAPAAAAFTIPLHGQNGSAASGQARAHRTASGFSIQLTIKGLKKLPAGEFYECWYDIPEPSPGHPQLITAGTFTSDGSGTVTMQMWSAADPRQFPVMEITAEKPGDAGQHGKIILIGRPSS